MAKPAEDLINATNEEGSEDKDEENPILARNENSPEDTLFYFDMSSPNLATPYWPRADEEPMRSSKDFKKNFSIYIMLKENFFQQSLRLKGNRANPPDHEQVQQILRSCIQIRSKMRNSGQPWEMKEENTSTHARMPKNSASGNTGRCSQPATPSLTNPETPS